MEKHYKWHVFKESCTDTSIGALVNIPLNFIMLSFAFSLNMDALETTVFMTIVFTIVAIIRKTIVGIYFVKKAKKRMENMESFN
jgi:hypothetical protein